MPVVLLLTSLTTQAKDLGGLPGKLNFSSTAFITSLATYESNYEKIPVLKVCACQLLTIRSKNQREENVVVFSEKINNGDLAADFAVATQVLEKEKKHMQLFFYEKVKVVDRKVLATDCKTFYKQLKLQNEDLRMYELLDADAISRFNNLNNLNR